MSIYSKLHDLFHARSSPAKLTNEVSRTAGTLSLEEVMQVYTHGRLARLTESLGEKYETVWRVLGDDDFLSLAERFVMQTPSRHWDINGYGEKFPEFIRNDPDLQTQPYLVEVAKLDQLMHELFHSADAPARAFPSTRNRETSVNASAGASAL